MWGWRRKETAMKVTAVTAGGTKRFVPLLCPAWLCENVTSIRNLLDVMDEKAAEHPGARMLTTLDDTGQAVYTSEHTADANDLDPLPEDDADDLPPPDFEIRRQRLLAAAQSVTLDQLRNRLWWTGEGRPSFFDLQDNPDAVLDRKETYIQAVPVEHAWEAVAAFPNGYFHGDFNPMENVVLARHLEQSFGYALFGIGASYLAFRRNAPLSADALSALSRFIIDLHADSNTPDLPAKIQQTLQATDLLVLSYVDR